jgi:ABC-type multidrug transport system fused ATPase/permease subunit
MNYDILHLDPDEHVILEVRKHWIVFAGFAASLLVMAILPCALFILLKIFLPKILPLLTLPGNSSAIFTFFYSLWLLFLWISFFIQWTKFHLDVWYVTEKRIIDVEQKQFFDREITNLRFDKIQDVTVDIHGLIPTFLNFGTVQVETAAENDGDFIMRAVRDPDNVRRVIFDRHNGN